MMLPCGCSWRMVPASTIAMTIPRQRYTGQQEKDMRQLHNFYLIIKLMLMQGIKMDTQLYTGQQEKDMRQLHGFYLITKLMLMQGHAQLYTGQQEKGMRQLH